MVGIEAFSALYIAGTLALCILYLIVWIYLSQESSNRISTKQRIIASGMLFCIVVAIYFVIPFTFIAIFMVIFSAITPFLMNIKWAFLISPLWSVPHYLVYHFYWDHNGAALNALLFWTFNLFALVMINSNIKERKARLEAEEANRQLLTTQALLNEAVKQGERVRIARNIHDLLGHHLTALTINLQVASRKTNDKDKDVKASIDQCHQLAKLLLSDVREAVSDIRDKSKIDLATSINAVLHNLPNLQVNLSVDSNIQLADIQVADAIIKCVQESITNTIKHAQGKQLCISLKQESEDSKSTNRISTIILEISNDGLMPTKINVGNGLIGMQERINALKGHIKFMLNQGKFCTYVSIPLTQYD